MLRVCRRLTCLLLATDTFLQVRWVPSERNVADQASRQWEHLRKHAFSPGGAGTEKEDAPYTSTWNPPSRDKVQPDTEKPKAVTSKTADQDPGRSEAEPLAGETRESDPAEVSRTDIFGADGSVKTGGRRLSATNAGLSPICPSPKSLTEDPGEGLQEIGRGLQLLRESHVRSRIRARRGHKVPRRNMRHVPRLWPEAHSCAHPAITAGMAEAGTPEDSTTSAVAVVGGSGHADVEATQNTLSSSSSPQLHRLPSPGRGSAPEKSRLGQPHASTEALVPFVASSRAARTVQGGPSGRSILLDSPLLPWIGPALRSLNSPGAFLLDITYYDLVQSWQAALKAIGLPKSHAVLYQLRHSGPSHDRFYKLRPLSEVKQRGRWQADSSVRRYEAHARLNQEFNDLPAAVQRKSQLAEQMLPKEAPRFFGLHNSLGFRNLR